jgi:hypothetical protein
MGKSLVTLCCLLTMGMPAFADGAATFPEAALTGNGIAWENDTKAPIVENESAEEESFQDLVQTVQWGGRTWTCFARSRRSGRTFSGQSRNANTARRIALNRCRSRSGSCFIRFCR